MPAKLFAVVILLCTTGLVFSQDREPRTWHMRDGRRTRQPLAVVAIDARVVSLQRAGSERLVRIVISSLSDEDQAYLREHFSDALAGRREIASSTIASPPQAAEADAREVRWPAPVVTDENLTRWVTFIRPTQEDLKWRDIRWHNNLAAAQDEARRLQRPILLWTMNGNPCGET